MKTLDHALDCFDPRKVVSSCLHLVDYRYRKLPYCFFLYIILLLDFLSVVFDCTFFYILLHLSSACDTIDDGLFFSRLIGSHLTCEIVIGKCTSDPHALDFGVPQGSVIGPLSFIMYTVPLENIVASYGIEVQETY